jgi:hypothetical protein
MQRIAIGPAVVLTAIVTAALTITFGPGARPGPAVGADPPAASIAATSPAPTYVTYVGSVSLDPVRGPAGTQVTMTGTGFEAEDELSIMWNTVRGSWVLKGEASEEFHGREFAPAAQQLTSVTTDPAGSFVATFTAPVGHGFSNDVTVERDGSLLNKAAFRLEPTVTIEPESGPVGTPINIRMEGIGWDNLENSWMVTYDNQFTGLLSAVTTDGVAEAVIPATGGPGKHVIRVIHGSFTVPYLNMQQSPRPDRPTFTLYFEVTPGAPVLPAEWASQGLAAQAGVAPAGDDVAIWTDPAVSHVGAPAVIHGRGFAPGAEVKLDWFTVIGNRVGGQGWDEAATELALVTAGSDGRFEYRLAVPDDLGGPHRIEAIVGEQAIAQAELTISPSVAFFGPTSGPVGTEITIQLKGVGWTETANIYNMNYDNAFLGYACGFNTQGDVTIHLPAAGEPGWHFIDLYPGIYKGKDVTGVQNFRIPQLTYEADHPGEDLPAFRFAFEVTP